jgi:uncharacterized protein YjbJ (UPF0337 family)
MSGPAIAAIRNTEAKVGTAVSKDSGPESAAKCLVEDVKGKAKEAVGTVTENDALKREGSAQQDKAESQREVATKEAEAEKARAKAKADEAREHGEHAAR